MVDVSKIRVGDEVTLKARVVGISQEPLKASFPVCAQVELCSSMWVSLNDIATHTPAPREVKVGDKVTSDDMDSRVYEVTKIDEGIAALFRWNKRGLPDVGWANVSELRHADEAGQ